MAPAGYPHDDRRNGYPQGPQGNHDDRPPPSDDRGAPPQELLPEGDYSVVAIKHAFGRSKSKKTEQIGVRLRITNGKHAGKFLLWYGSFTDKSEEFTIKGLRALGFQGDDPSVAADWDDMYKRAEEATAVVQHDTWEGVTRAKVAFINGADIVMGEDMSERDLKSFGARMRGAFKQYGGGKSSTGKLDDRRDERREQTTAPRDERQRWASENANRDDRRQGSLNDARRNEPPPVDDGDEPWNDRPSYGNGRR